METPPTLRDVARLADVSEATASRALRGLRHVAPGTALAVHQAADRLGFVASRSAATLATGRARLVGVVTPSTVSWFSSSVLQGVDGVLREAGYAVALLALIGPDGERRRLTEQVLRTGQAAAHAVLGVDLDVAEQALLRRLSTPVVTVGGAVEGVRGIGIPEEAAAALAVRHLTDLGHRRIAHIGADGEDGVNPSITAARRQGWEAELRERGVRPEGSWFAPGGFAIETGRDAALRLLTGPAAPTAVFAATDIGAFGVLLAAQRLGLRVPQDLSVAGLDDHPFSSAYDLTTVRQSPSLQGARAAAVLLRDLGVPRPVPPAAPVELVVRGSTAPPAHRGASR